MQNKKPISAARKVAYLGILVAVALVLSFLENGLLSLTNLAVPGAKPGLANLAVILGLAYLGPVPALVISLIKASAVFLATGAVTTLWYSLAGSLASILVMTLLWKLAGKWFSFAGISALGGAMSNMAQLCIMVLLTGTKEVFLYCPFALAFGSLFGFLIGWLANLILRKIPVAKDRKED